MNADVFRCYGRSSILLFWKGIAFDPTLRVVLTHRLASRERKWAGGRFLTLFFKVVHRWAQRKAGVDFPSSSVIGVGLKITHGWGLVVTGDAQIGSNVTLFNGVTIGRKDVIGPNGRISGFPIIGNDVWVGPHAVIVGAVKVGDGAIVAPGSIVIKDVQPGQVVGGNPARVLKEVCVADVVNRVHVSVGGNRSGV